MHTQDCFQHDVVDAVAAEFLAAPQPPPDVVQHIIMACCCGDDLRQVVDYLLRGEALCHKVFRFRPHDVPGHDFFTAGEFHEVCHSLVVVDGKVVGFFQLVDEV